MTPGFREFEFDLPEALLANLISMFDTREGASLASANVDRVPDAQGVYQLLLGNEIVYIGKTDGEAGLRKRLGRHAWTIQHRRNLDPTDVKFKALRVYVFTAVDLETQLIHHYKRGASVAWNNSGFGSNDPGRQRDTTRAKPGSFDALFPVDLDREINLDVQSPATASAVITALKRALPYTLRVEGAADPRKPHSDLEPSQAILPNSPTTARGVLKAVLKGLPRGWQGTLLAGRIILYKERRDYPFGEVIGRSK